MLGIFGDTQKIGKPMASDLVEGKMTLLVVRALALASAMDAERLRFLLKQGTKITGEDVEEFRKLLRDTGALASVQAYAREAILASKQMIEAAMDIPEEAREFLVGLADYMAGREY